jgi:predicted ABC-type ATPase
MHEQFPQCSLQNINSEVWEHGRHRLNHVIRKNVNFAFGTTLGGASITNSLLDAIAAGAAVSVWYCGLICPEVHIERVAARVARGDHAIAEALIWIVAHGLIVEHRRPI